MSGLPPPRPPAPDDAQPFVERRRARFIATFQSRSDEILDLLDDLERRGRTAAVIDLRHHVHRIRALARIAGFDGVTSAADAFESVLAHEDALVEVTRARELLTSLYDALGRDLAAGPAPATPPSVAALRILLVDDHAVLRGGVRAFLSSRIPGAMFGEADDGAAAMELLRRHRWDVALLDVSLPGRTGLELLQEIKGQWPRLPVLVLSAHREDEVALRAFKAGADGYMMKHCAPDELITAVRKVVGGGRYVSPSLAEQLAAAARHDQDRLPHQLLSNREYDVMCRIAQGRTVGEIATEMSLSVKTISTYRTRLLEKLRLRNNAEIVQYALRNHLVC